MVDRPDLTVAMSHAVDPMELMQRVTDRTLELIEASNGVLVGLADEGGVTYVCGAGHRVSHLGTRVGLDNSLSGVTVKTGDIQLSNDTATDPRVDREACRRLSVASAVTIPLTRMHETIGVLAVNANRPNAFTDDDVETLRHLAEFVSVAIGSAVDISRVSAELLQLHDPVGDAEEAEDADHRPRAADTSRYVMSVLSPTAGSRIDSDQRIRQVLDAPDALSMVFQPIIDLGTGAVAAVEALARFDVTPYRPPDLWFEEAHRCDLGIQLENLAIAKAIASLPRLPHGVALSVNAGPEAALSPEFLERLPARAAPRLILELTEHTAIDDYPGLISSLRELRRSGLRIAIDDTGSGHSTLAHILKLAPDFIKLDRELTSGIDLDPVRRALAASLVTFAADTGAHIIAEGVEAADELDVLRDLGVSYAQGYHLGHPAPLDLLSALHGHPAGPERTRPGGRAGPPID